VIGSRNPRSNVQAFKLSKFQASGLTFNFMLFADVISKSIIMLRDDGANNGGGVRGQCGRVRLLNAALRLLAVNSFP
jgi:hypothetical protein